MCSKSKGPYVEEVFRKRNLLLHQCEINYSTQLADSLRSSRASSSQNVPIKNCPQPPDDLESSELGNKITSLWQRELKSKGSIKASLTMVLFRCILWDMLDALFWTLCVRALVPIAITELFSRILISIEELNLLREDPIEFPMTSAAQNQNLSTDLSQNLSRSGDIRYINIESSDWDSSEQQLKIVYNKLLILASGFWFMVMIYYVLISNIKFKLSRCGLKCQIILTNLIQRKSMKLDWITSLRESSSKPVSLISNEVQFVEDAQKYLVSIIAGPISLLLSSLWLVTQVRWQPVLPTIPLIGLMITIHIYTPKLYKRVSQRRKSETNKRIDLISTFLTSIKVMKLYAWESNFLNQIRDIRFGECKQLRNLDKFLVFDLVFLNIATRILTSAMIIVSILVFKNLDPRIIFTGQIAYQFCRVDGIFYFPKSLKSLSDVRTACRNIKQYLILPEKQDDRVWLAPETVRNKDTREITLSCRNVSLSIANPSQLSSAKPESTNIKVFEGLDLELVKGDLVFVIGHVGSGKSSLLRTFLGELRIASGQLRVHECSAFAYASQEACIFSESIKDNILNGRPYNSSRYMKVVKVCALERDISILPQGDATVVGPKGVSLSGGQRARVNLARAIYSEADVYLLDDPLSAVDSRVCKQILKDCIQGFLRGKTVVLATHQVHLIHEAATKIIMLARGRRPVVGDAQELLESSKEVNELLSHEQRQTGSRGVDDGQKRETQTSQSNCDDLLEAAAARDNEQTDDQLTKKQHFGSKYVFLIKLGNSVKCHMSLALNCVMLTLANFIIDYYFRIWSSNVKSEQHRLSLTVHDGANDVTVGNVVNTNGTATVRDASVEGSMETFLQRMVEFWLIYVGLILAFTIINVSGCWQICRYIRRSTSALHDSMIDSLFRAKMKFFDQCRLGELTSRCAGDIAVIDHSLPTASLYSIIIFVSALAAIIPIAIINPVQLLPYAAIFLICCPIAAQKYGRLKVLISAGKRLRAPVYTTLSTIVDELCTIRSEADHSREIQAQFNANQNKLTSISLLAMIYECRLTISMKLGSMSSFGVMMYIMFVLYWQDLELSKSGTFLLFAMNAASIFPGLMEYILLTETAMASVSNMRLLTKLEPEVDQIETVARCQHRDIRKSSTMSSKLTMKIDSALPAATGSRALASGRVSFNQVTLAYKAGARPALDRLSFSISAGERVGIVGRTGAGKSSIVGVMFRLYDYSGSITIGGLDTKSLTLAELRSSLGVIPQDPVLFSDTLRKNLDPFDAFTDEEIWRSLKMADLDKFVENNLGDKLLYQVSENGRNFSVGQRQLICLVRAILRSPRVLMIDEATANVDSETDSSIQRAIRSCFAGSTIITIAHRLHTILDYDRVMVLDAGRVVEFDTVDRLLALPDGVFRSMLQTSSSSSDQ